MAPTADNTNGSSSGGVSFLQKFAAVSVVLFLIVAGAGWFLYADTTEQLTTSTQDQLVTSSEGQAQVMEQYDRTLSQSLLLLSDTQVIQSGDVDDISTFLDLEITEQNRLQAGASALHYYDPDSDEVLASTESDAEGQSLDNRDGFNLEDLSTQLIDDSDTAVTGSFDREYSDDRGMAYVTQVPGQDEWLIIELNLVDVGQQLNELGDGDVYVVDSEGEIRTSTNTDYIGTDIDQNQVINQELLDEQVGLLTTRATYFESTHSDIERASAVSPVSATEFIVVSEVPREQAFALQTSVNQTLLGSAAALLVGLLFAGLVVGRGIRDVATVSERAKEVAENPEVDVNLETSRGDEIGDLYRAVDSMRVSMRDRLRDAEEAQQEVQEVNSELTSNVQEFQQIMADSASGDLQKRMPEDSDIDPIRNLAIDYNNMMNQLEGTLREAKRFGYEVATASEEVTSGIREVKSASDEVTSATQEISDGAARQNERLDETADEMNNLSATIEEVASSAGELAERSAQAEETSQEGRDAAEDAVEALGSIEQQTEQAVGAVESLNDEMDNISEVVEFISEVAEQTNMLAINARVEAARAGEAGEGFAVVADEVKGLADETAQAADDIEASLTRLQEKTESTADDIEATQESVERGTATIEDALEALEEIARAVEDTNAGIQEIDDAAERQADTAEDVVYMVDEVANISEETASQAQGVAAASEEQTASIAQVSDSVNDLAEQATRLNDELAEFDVGLELDTSNVNVGRVEDDTPEDDSDVDFDAFDDDDMFEGIDIDEE